MWLFLSLRGVDEITHLVNHNWWLDDFLSLGSLPLAGCGGWHHVKCVREKERERERERERETLTESVLDRLTLVKLKKPNFSYNKTSLTFGRESCNSDFLLTDWMAKSSKRAYQSFMSTISILQLQPPIRASISVHHIQHIMLIVPLILSPPIYLWRKVVCFVLFCNHEIHQTEVFQIMFLVSLEKTLTRREGCMGLVS